MDERQAHVHENFPTGSWLSDPEHVARVMEWVTYWRRNAARFIEYYFGVTLFMYERIILFLMEFYPSICIVAARSSAKSYIIALFACKEAILKPGSIIVIGSATKKQARLIVSEKIKKNIMPGSPLLQQEIASIRDSANEIEVIFHNGSSIIVVVANDNSRGYRANVLIYEEFRMITKYVVDSVFSPFLIARQAPFMQMQIKEYEALREEPKEIYISSAWYCSHWMWGTIKGFTNDMLTNGASLMIAMDYSVLLAHGIKTVSYLQKERRKMDSITFAIEYENRMIRENTKAYFTRDMFTKNSVLKNPFYPRSNEEVLSRARRKTAMPKQPGEIRIVSCDMAFEGGSKNDNSIFSLIRALPERKEYKMQDSHGDRIEVEDGYRRQLVYLEPVSEFETSKQAIRIKQLYEDFEADYCVLDARNGGILIYDALAKILYDEERNIEYAPWTCMNDDKAASRIVIAGQLPVVYLVKASVELNSKIATTFRKTLENGMFELLVNPQEGEEELATLYPDYLTADVDRQILYERPFLETAAFIHEAIELEYTVMSQTGMIRVEERSGERKDRYTSVSYGNYFINLMEQERISSGGSYGFVPLYN